MDDVAHTRYSRHILLPQLGHEGQQKLLAARVIIVGLGGLGSPCAMYLAASGVGHLTLCDFDRVELTNLQRQIVHGTPDLGRPKVESARDTLLNLNPGVQIQTEERVLNDDQLDALVAQHDLVIDCSDNFMTRFSVNRSAVVNRKPLVSGAAIRFQGQVFSVDPRHPMSACYQCLYPDVGSPFETCAGNGVLAPLVGVVGSLQAVEAIKVLGGIKQNSGSRLWTIDALTLQTRVATVAKDPHCPICAMDSAAKSTA